MHQPPGTEKPRRFRPRFHWELLVCGTRGHELLGMDVRTIRREDAVVVREENGVRWYRCVRCDSWLPLAPPEEDVAVESAASIEPVQSGRVLVVEDEAHVREVTARLLQRAGYEVVTACNAETALQVLASSTPFDLVLTDSAMPGMRGEDLAAEIARVQPGLPVLLMSGYSSGLLEQPSCWELLRKPYTREELGHAMAKVLRAAQ